MKKGSYWIGTMSNSDQKKFKKDITELHGKKRFVFIMDSYYATFERFISCSFDVSNNEYWNEILLRSKML